MRQFFATTNEVASTARGACRAETPKHHRYVGHVATHRTRAVLARADRHDTRVVGTAPTVGLRPMTPFMDAGDTIDPSVSVPTASGARPAAIAAAPDPDDEPPAERSSAHGLATSPPVAEYPLVERGERMLAH